METFDNGGDDCNAENENIAADLLDDFKSRNVLLYVGRNTAVEDISGRLASLPWQYVITSNRDLGFGAAFTDATRRHIVCTTLEKVAEETSDHLVMPIIQIYGNTGEDADTDNDYGSKVQRKREASKLMNRIMGCMNLRSTLVITGYAADDEGEFPLDDFYALLQEIKNCSVYIFGVQGTGDGTKQLRKLSDGKGFVWCDSGLREVLECIDTDEDIGASSNDIAENSLFYMGGRSVTIPTKLLLRCSNFAQLLTDENIGSIEPFGRAAQSIWYYNFLNDSSVSPQWYGYRTQSLFYLQRSFEEKLVDWTQRMLDDTKPHMHHGPAPIILSGPPCSSKSVELAALGYKIFCGKISPVIFIKDDSLLLGSANEDEMEQLDELLMSIERCGQGRERILVLWDCSSYRDVPKMARDLVGKLEGGGRRRFALVCTAYDSTNVVDKKDFTDGCYFIKSSREMTNPEVFNLKQDIKKYLKMSDAQIRRICDDTDGETQCDIFMYFYKLINEIRPMLEKRLSHEHKAVSAYIHEYLSNMLKKQDEEDRNNSIMAQALIEAGVTSTNRSEDDKDTELARRFDIERFDICVAMFSRFKLDTPYELAITMGCKNSRLGINGDTLDKDLFSLITSCIPWIYYMPDTNGKFVFRYRNSIEADIRLKDKGVDADRQVNTVADMLDVYATICRSREYENIGIKQSLLDLLRMIGPNSRYTPFMQNEEKFSEHQALLKKLDVLIGRLAKMRQELPQTINNFDFDAGFASIEVTFTRELYGALWDTLNDGTNGAGSTNDSDAYTLRLKKLQDARDLALAIIDKAEKTKQNDRTQRQINALKVETAYCEIRMRNILDKSGNTVSNPMSSLTYGRLYQMLLKAIDFDPTSGYAYNALFKLFEGEYARREENSTKRLLMLSEICSVVDDASALDAGNRGMDSYDEIGKHIINIKSLYGKFDVSIANVLNGGCPEEFKSLFDDMLNQDRAAGIMFVCQKEIERAHLDGKTIFEWERQEGREKKEYVLTQEQLDVCRKILEFMRMEKHIRCVDKDSRALYMMLRVQWMLCNKRALNCRREVQLTYIDMDGWQNIAQICEKYESCSEAGRMPLVTLIHALAIVQLDGNYTEANRMVESTDAGANRRMSVPYMLCDEGGNPRLYSGVVRYTKNYSGFITVNGIPSRLCAKDGIRFSLGNLGRLNMPHEGEPISDLELGLGYTGFAVYQKAGRENKASRI